MLLADQLQPPGSVEIPQLIHIAHGLLLGHIVDDDLEDAVEHPAGDDVAQLGIQLGRLMPQTVQNLQVLEGVFHFDLHHVVDEMLIAGALGLAQ